MWEIYSTISKRNDSSFISERFPSYDRVSKEAFGKVMEERFDLERLIKFFNRSEGFAELRQDNKLKCYAFFTVGSSKSNDIKILWIDNIANTLKGKGILLIDEILKQDKEINFVGCRTQNPGMIKLIQKYGKTYPIDLDYDSNNGKLILEFILTNIEEGKEVVSTIEMNNGISRKRYVDKNGNGYRLGDYETDSPKFADIENKLKTFNFQRDNGDAVMVIADRKIKNGD